MLIRSQDRRFLISIVGGIFGIFFDDIYKIRCKSINGNATLGVYDSEKRCVEILNEIQREYQYANHYSHSGVNSLSCQGFNYGIYEMPER